MSTRQRLLLALDQHDLSTNEALAKELNLPVLAVAASMRRMESNGLVKRVAAVPAKDWKGRDTGGPRRIVWAKVG